MAFELNVVLLAFRSAVLPLKAKTSQVLDLWSSSTCKIIASTCTAVMGSAPCSRKRRRKPSAKCCRASKRALPPTTSLSTRRAPPSAGTHKSGPAYKLRKPVTRKSPAVLLRLTNVYSVYFVATSTTWPDSLGSRSLEHEGIGLPARILPTRPHTNK